VHGYGDGRRGPGSATDETQEESQAQCFHRDGCYSFVVVPAPWGGAGHASLLVFR
jgi:hypothetical protein